MPEVDYPKEDLPPDDTSLHSSDELHQPLVDFVAQGAASPYGFFCTRLFNQREFLMRTGMNLETGAFNWYY